MNRPVMTIVLVVLSALFAIGCGDECDTVATTCPGTCAAVQGLAFDDENDCVLLGDTQGCIETLGGESDVAACAVRRSDGQVFRLVGGADAWRLIHNTAAWTTCETEVEAEVLAAPACGAEE